MDNRTFHCQFLRDDGTSYGWTDEAEAATAQEAAETVVSRGSMGPSTYRVHIRDGETGKTSIFVVRTQLTISSMEVK